MASAFTKAMDANITKITGENGAAELSSTSDPRVDLFFALVRNLPDDRLHELVKNCFATSLVASEEMAVDMFLLAFQTRHCRGGKGERALFLKLFLELADRFPQTVLKLITLIPKYGYYKDLFLLVSSLDGANKESFQIISEHILTFVADQLSQDMIKLQKKQKDISILAKWAPREGHAQSSIAKRLAAKMFPGSSTARAQYRKTLSQLNSCLKTVEVMMCGHAWDEINPSSVPSLTLMRNRKAFLNEKLKVVPNSSEMITGNRFPNDPSRVNCRKRVREALVSTGMKKLKGKQLFPHEISKLLMDFKQKSTVELEVFNAQWQAIRTSTQEALEKKRAEQAEHEQPGNPKGVDLGKLVALVDVSGSMSGTPMEVAVALGILVSELADPAFAHRVITFHDNPTWCTFEPEASIAEKVKKAVAAPWGGSTNFEKAMELILEVAVNAKLSPEEIPNLIIFSDMQFNVACRSQSKWETHHERLSRRFAEAGMRICGRPYPTPEITYWNLRGNTVGFPVDADAPNVRMLSGFSPSILKLILSGEPLQTEVVEEELSVDEGGGVVVSLVKKKVQVDPLTTLRKALDDTDYDDVRVVLSESNEGVLSSYTFIPPVIAVPVEGKAAAEEEEGGAAMKDDWEEVEN
jgi:hypothetical protein